jgi:hypothetical protein
MRVKIFRSVMVKKRRKIGGCEQDAASALFENRSQDAILALKAPCYRSGPIKSDEPSDFTRSAPRQSLAKLTVFYFLWSEPHWAFHARSDCRAPRICANKNFLQVKSHV